MSKELTGVLFRNKKKLTDKHPEYTGKMMLGGAEYRLAGWINEHDEHGKYLSLKITPPEDAKPVSKPATPKPVETDDIPF